MTGQLLDFLVDEKLQLLVHHIAPIFRVAKFDLDVLLDAPKDPSLVFFDLLAVIHVLLSGLLEDSVAPLHGQLLLLVHHPGLASDPQLVLLQHLLLTCTDLVGYPPVLRGEMQICHSPERARLGHGRKTGEAFDLP